MENGISAKIDHGTDDSYHGKAREAGSFARIF
jgi:hypothetical protein